MTPDVVVDIGTSRVKWGRCASNRVAEMVGLSLDGRDWDRQASVWSLARGTDWAMIGVNPPVQARFAEWCAARGDRVRAVNHISLVPLQVDVDEPDRVGLDRLMNALAAHLRSRPRPAAVVSVGTAVTVDYVDETGAFRGGMIFPGPTLMARSLHDYTAKLPLVGVGNLSPAQTPIPGRNTTDAIRAGILTAVRGGILVGIDIYGDPRELPVVFVTGGGADLLESELRSKDVHFVPELTLEGVRLAAETLP